MGATGRRRGARARVAAVAAAGAVAVAELAGAAVLAPPAPAQPQTTAPLVVHAGSTVRPINRDLLGIHSKASASSIASSFDDIAPRTHRHVMSAADFMHYDCATSTIDPASLAYFDAWLDAVDAEGAEAILALSYTPECVARDGQPKGPTTDPVVYRQFLDQLLGHLVTARAADGKAPLRRFELWNEPDIPAFDGDPGSGHGWVGTLDEFVTQNLPSLAGAILQAEGDSGVDVEVGTPAAFTPWPFSHDGADIVDLLVRVNGFDRATAEQIAAGLDALLPNPYEPPLSVRLFTYGGFQWPRRVTDEAAKLGLKTDFASVHFYPNNPLQGPVQPGSPEPVLLFGRHPFASPDQLAELTQRWHAEFPGMELVVSEWAPAGDVDWRRGSCEAASFDAAALSVMQDAGTERALYLHRPPGPEDAAFRTWAQLPATQVARQLPAGVPSLWATAASDADRTTVLASQWWTRLEDALDRTVPLHVDGLADGTYDLTIEWIGQDHPVSPGRLERTVQVVGGAVELGDPIPLPGQALARVDLRRAGVAPLPPLTLANDPSQAKTCLLPRAAPPTTTTAPSSTTATTATPAVASAPTPTPNAVTPAFTG